MQYAEQSDRFFHRNKYLEARILFGRGTDCSRKDHFVILSQTIGKQSILSRSGSCFKSFGDISRREKNSLRLFAHTSIPNSSLPQPLYAQSPSSFSSERSRSNQLPQRPSNRNGVCKHIFDWILENSFYTRKAETVLY